MPSTAEDAIPPAYPAPSPIGYNPLSEMLSMVSASLRILTGEELLVSTPVSTAA
jgi:hypothetical protein